MSGTDRSGSMRSGGVRGGRGGRGGMRGSAHNRGDLGDSPHAEHARETTTKREVKEIAALEARIAAEAPPPGSSESAAEEFSALPLSRYTLTGLAKGGFTRLTAIQRIAIPHALAGRDVLGAAKTGSGKTLAFIVPLLERLFRSRWSGDAGLGALVISPTRELAMQIFEVLRAVGSAHFSLSAGLLTGGKDFAEEAASVGRMSILVATPGRLLQHLEQTPELDASGCALLVLDEADRLLDMGFSDALTSILSYLPPPTSRGCGGGRQTLLFSATQTRSVRDLARLSFATTPEYASVHEAAASATPARLSQHYVIARAHEKVNLLYSFLRSHTSNKTIVFVSSCKQSRFLFEAFRRLRPGVPLQLLHGKMKHARRQIVYYDFLKKPAAVLFATDVAARGLDFPDVDWVLQLDAPEDAAAYIHRVGRTARFKAKGHALLALAPREAEVLLPAFTAARIPLAQTHIAPSAAVSVTSKLAAELAADPELKALAVRAFSSFVRSVALQPNRDAFRVSDLDAASLAESFGLASTPPVKLLRGLSGAGAAGGGVSGSVDVLAEDVTHESAGPLRDAARARKNENKGLARLKEKIAAERAARAAANGGGGAASATSSKLGEVESDEDDEGAVLRPKRGGEGDGEGKEAPLHVGAAELAGLGDRDRARLMAVVRDTRLLGAGGAMRGSDGLTPFQRVALAKEAEAAAMKAGEGEGALDGEEAPRPPRSAPIGGERLRDASDAYTARVAQRLAANAVVDRARERERVRSKHQEDRLARKRARVEEEGEGEGERGVQLAMKEEEGEEEEGDDEEEDTGGYAQRIARQEAGWVGGKEGVSSGSEGEGAAPPKKRAAGGRVEDLEEQALAQLKQRR